ncbi:MAG: hypothetical protein KC620_10090 [Myxococcales bacterium]|nr:hypothetical protein [Myxococcales bacterium]
MTLSIVDLAARAGLVKTGTGWGPCPICKADRSGRKDKRGPLRLSDDQWLCVASAHEANEWGKNGGGPVSFAKALVDAGLIAAADTGGILKDGDENELPTDALPAARQRLVERLQAGPVEVREASAAGEGEGADAEPAAETVASAEVKLIDVAGGYAALVEQGDWRGIVRGWARARGFTEEMSVAIDSDGTVAGIPAGRWPVELREWLREVYAGPLRLLIPLRDPQGQVVTLERRWPEAGHPPDDGPKTMRLPTEKAGSHPIAFFGDLPAAIEAAKQGLPIALVEGSADWLAVEASMRVRGRGVALGAASARSLPNVATAIVRACQKAKVQPGTFDVFVVPHVGDLDDRPHHRDHHIGERMGWQAAEQLCDVARTWWCPPASTPGDVCDAAFRSAEADDEGAAPVDPVDRVWTILEGGSRVLEVGPDAQRWRLMVEEELAQHFYRLPLAAVIEALHWNADYSDGEAPKAIHAKTIWSRGMESGDTRLVKTVLAWLRHHGVTFYAEKDGAWVYDPLNRAELHVGTRQIPRLFRVRSKQWWAGWLQQVGWILTKTPDGRVIEEGIHQRAQRSHTMTLRPWLTATGNLANCELRVLLHACDQVLQVRRDDVQVGVNRGSTVLISEDDVRPIQWRRGASAAEFAHLLYQLIALNISAKDSERTMMVSWILLAFVRELIETRPVLLGTGATGAGKSFTTKMFAALIYGNHEPGCFTSASLWQASERQPYLALDNKNTKFLTPADEEFLLSSATGVRRYRRASGTDSGLLVQQPTALVHPTAVDRPSSPELLRRTLIVEHAAEHRLGGFRDTEVINAIKAERHTLWSGAAQFFAHEMMRRFAAGQHHELADRVPSGHPLDGLRQSLGVMACIGGALANLEPRWGPDPGSMVRRWCEDLDVHVRDTRRHADPLGLALESLLHAWNRVVVTPYGDKRRPAIDDAQFVCKPLFRLAPAFRKTPSDWTDNPDRAELSQEHRVPMVCGFTGTYVALREDLEKAVHGARAFVEAFPSADAVRWRVGMVEGWTSQEAGRAPRKGLRLYRWLAEADDAAAGESQPEQGGTP